MRPHGTGVLYILKDKLQLYSTLQPTILEYHFQPQSIDHLTIVGKELLDTHIMQFVSKNDISPCNLIVVMADNASHIKMMTHDQSEEEQTKNFTTTAPFFPHLVTKTIATPNGSCLYGVNYDLCEGIKEAFEKVGFSIDFVLPALAFGNDFSDKEKLSAKDIEVVLKEVFVKEEYNLIPTKMVPDEKELDNVMKDQTNKDVMRLYAASIFGALIIGIFVAWNNSNPQPTQTYRGRANNELNAIIMPSAQETEDLRVQIIHTPATTATTVALLGSLKKYNFKSLNTLLMNKQEKAEVRFTSRTSPKVRAAMLVEVGKYVKDVTVVEELDNTFDVTITLP
jgi:hypothetical protein